MVDPDDHHLFTNLGCAAENLSLAAGARGFKATPIFDAAGDGAINVTLETSRPLETASFAAITARQCSRADYDGKAVPESDFSALVQAARSGAVDIIILTDPRKIEPITALVLEGNDNQFNDPAFITELKRWIRFERGRGVGGPRRTLRSSERQSDRALLDRSNDLWFRCRREGRAGQVFPSDEKLRGYCCLCVGSGRQGAFGRIGRSYQRFALEATARGIKHAFVNQAVEVKEMRERLRQELNVAGRPDLIVRIGYGPAMPRSLRRPVEAVIV